MRAFAYAGLGLLLGGIAYAAPAGAESREVAAGLGHGLAQRLCTSCHLVEPGATNPIDHVGGPAFQTVADRPETTERSLRRHLRTTHSNTMIPLAMPNPQLSEDELVKIISYIVSLRAPAVAK
jgi:mono/diheme cytochrome c family protein